MVDVRDGYNAFRPSSRCVALQQAAVGLASQRGMFRPALESCGLLLKPERFTAGAKDFTHGSHLDDGAAARQAHERPVMVQRCTAAPKRLTGWKGRFVGANQQP